MDATFLIIVDMAQSENLRTFGWLQYVHGTRKAGVKRVDNSQDLDRFVDVPYGSADQSLLHRSAITSLIPGRSVPEGGSDDLIIGYFTVCNIKPMAEGSTWCFCEPI